MFWLYAIPGDYNGYYNIIYTVILEKKPKLHYIAFYLSTNVIIYDLYRNYITFKIQFHQTNTFVVQYNFTGLVFKEMASLNQKCDL